MTNPTEIFAELQTAFEEQIATADFVISRMANHAVIADPQNGNCVLREGGCWPIPAECGRVAMIRSADEARAELARMQAEQPDNHVLQRLEVMGFKKAARLQRANAETVLADIEAKLAA